MIQDPIDTKNETPKTLEDRFFHLDLTKPITMYHYIILFFLTVFNCIMIIKSLLLMQELFKQIIFAILLGGLLIYFVYATIRAKPSYRFSSYLIGLWGVAVIILYFVEETKSFFLLIIDFFFWFYFMMIIEGILSGVPESYDKIRQWRKNIRSEIDREGKEGER